MIMIIKFINTIPSGLAGNNRISRHAGWIIPTGGESPFLEDSRRYPFVLFEQTAEIVAVA